MLNYGTADAKSLKLSFWIKSSVVGTYAVSLRTSTLGTSGMSSCHDTFEISTANTWQKVTHTFPANTAYDTVTSDVTAIFLDICFGARTTHATSTLNTWELGNYPFVTGQTDVLQTSGATINITAVQLEVGTTATPFETLMHPQQLSMCQRYYFNFSGTLHGGDYSTNGFVTGVFPVEMRVAPTITYTATRTPLQGLGFGYTKPEFFSGYMGNSPYVQNLVADAEI